MRMRQSSSNYSENDSAELQLDTAIQNYIAPNVGSSVDVEFDGYGTLHVLERNSDGRLLSDSYLAKREDDIPEPLQEFTNADKLEVYIRKNAGLSKLLKLQKILIILFSIGFVLFCILLKMTLQRYM
ncbi:MAG: hypothetical protein NC131_19035 [Roseburia sp.]|nr:hypothetical protein [Roseburia sp.]